MVSEALVKLSSPVARSCLIALGIALLIDATLTFFAASQYPYLIPYTRELYLPSASSITLVYSAIGAAAILLAISTAVASYKSSTNFVLVHACITGVFLPVALLVYFSSLTTRYKVVDYVDEYKQMIADYRVGAKQIKTVDTKLNSNDSSASVSSANNAKSTSHDSAINTTHHDGADNHQAASTLVRELKLVSFINLIDSIQSKFLCCGVESHEDWIKAWDNFIPASCCSQPVTSSNTQWSSLFKVEPSHEFHHCPADSAQHLGCLAALKEDEKSKFAWLSNLIVFLMVMTITNTIVTLLLYGLKKTEDMPYDEGDNELAMVGVSAKPRPSQPEITGIRHRPSVVHTLGASKEQISAISHAVRFNLANSSPRGSVSGPSKFSAGARRGSAFV